MHQLKSDMIVVQVDVREREREIVKNLLFRSLLSVMVDTNLFSDNQNPLI